MVWHISQAPRGALAARSLLVGSPQEVAEKILLQHGIFAHQRFLLQLSVGTMPHADLMRAIELFGMEVAPAVRNEVASRSGASEIAAIAGL